MYICPCHVCDDKVIFKTVLIFLCAIKERDQFETKKNKVSQSTLDNLNLQGK